MSGGLRWRPQTSVYATGGASRNPRTQSYRWHPSLPGKRRRIGVDVVEADEREERVRGMDREKGREEAGKIRRCYERKDAREQGGNHVTIGYGKGRKRGEARGG